MDVTVIKASIGINNIMNSHYRHQASWAARDDEYHNIKNITDVRDITDIKAIIDVTYIYYGHQSIKNVTDRDHRHNGIKKTWTKGHLASKVQHNLWVWLC